MIKQIFHISDIHIHLYRKNKQYVNVLENLIKKIKQYKTENSIIIITGDLFHTKTQMSPQSIQMADLYLTSLSAILPTIVIAGNHDTNLSNKNRLDCIGPITSLLNNERVIYYKDTGWYIFDDLNIWVSSVFDQRLPKQGYKQNKNICLYHGCVESVKVNDIQLSYKFHIEDFNKFDFVLLGDIHQTQIVNTNPLTAYAGSLIQLNFGEEIQQHGFLLWDLEKNNVKHIQVDNDYAYYNVIVDKGQLVQVPKITAKHPRIKIKYSNTTHLQLNDIQDFFKQQFHAQQIMLSKIHQQFIGKSSTFKYNLNNVQSVPYQQVIIRQYIQHINRDLSQKDISSIIQLNKDINQKVHKTTINVSQSIWSIEKLQFDNFFSYGQGNVVQFSKHKGIVGIIGENRVGKSALIDVILFLLFDRTPRTTKSISLLNTKKDKLWGKITLSIDGKFYIIQRQGILNQKYGSMRVRCRFYTFNEDGQKIDLSGIERSDTNNIIQQYLGTYEDALSTFFSTQGNSNTFIQSTNTNRKALLNSLLNLNIFDYCYLQANEQSKELKGYINNTDLQNINASLTNSRNNLQKLYQSNKQLENLIAIQYNQLQEKELKLKQLFQSKKNFSENYIDIEQVNISISQCQLQKIKLKEKYQRTLVELKENEIQKQQLQVIIAQFKYTHQIKKQETLRESKNKYDLLLNNKKIKQIQLKQNTKKVSLLQQVEYNADCKYCMNNPLTKDAIASKQAIIGLKYQIQQINNLINDLQKDVQQFTKLSKQISIYEKDLMPEYQKYITLNSENTKTISELTASILLNQTQLQKLNNLRQAYLLNQKTLQENHNISIQIGKLEDVIYDQKKKVKSLQSEILSNKISITTNEQIINKNLQDKQKYINIVSKYSIIQSYKDIIGKNGLQYHITSNVVSQLQYQINEILSIIANFTVQFVFQGKYIDINIVYSDKTYQAETCSGFEKFIISIAIRHALSTITNKSKGKIFVIDEGFGVLDSENAVFIDRILEFIASKYQTLLVISHLENMKTMFNEQIHIQYKKGYSNII